MTVWIKCITFWPTDKSSCIYSIMIIMNQVSVTTFPLYIQIMSGALSDVFSMG